MILLRTETGYALKTNRIDVTVVCYAHGDWRGFARSIGGLMTHHAGATAQQCVDNMVDSCGSMELQVGL